MQRDRGAKTDSEPGIKGKDKAPTAGLHHVASALNTQHLLCQIKGPSWGASCLTQQTGDGPSHEQVTLTGYCGLFSVHPGVFLRQTLLNPLSISLYSPAVHQFGYSLLEPADAVFLQLSGTTDFRVLLPTVSIHSLHACLLICLKFSYYANSVSFPALLS